jgi:hypothetical protein
MKTRNILIIALSAIMFAGCTAESLLNEPTTDLTKNQEELTNEVRVVNPFEFNGFGDMVLIKPGSLNLCEKLNQIDCNGITSENILGRFKTVTRICTDNENTHMLEGSHIFQRKGDELFFYSNKWGIDESGQVWMIYEYYAGSGRFEGTTGMVKVYENRIWTTATRGTYSNHGEGTLSMKQ